MNRLSLVLLFAAVFCMDLQGQIMRNVNIGAITLEPQQSGLTASLRGLDALDHQIVWVSGGNGRYASTRDGGVTWMPGSVPGADSLDFRDVVILDEKTVLLMSAGSGDKSQIYKTVDGGDNWQAIALSR